jgi:threonine/homoserine/homoserine lactone efflux protein
MTILEMLFIGFTVGLTGAVAPGPMLFATIESSLKTGWSAGPRIVLGHAVLEILICVSILIGMSAIMNESAIRVMSFIGGVSLCIFGGMIIKNRKNARLEINGSFAVISPALAGIITSASNPYFWLWWLSAGSGLIMEGLKTGIIAAGFFVLGHWIADGFWYSLVSGSFSRGRTLMPDSVYRRILTACGLFLIVFGLWFIVRNF